MVPLWWATLESNQACVSARELQSPEVRGNQYQWGGQCLHGPRINSSDSLCPEKSLVNLKKLERPLTLLSPLRKIHGANAVAAVYSRHLRDSTKTSEEYLAAPK